MRRLIAEVNRDGLVDQIHWCERELEFMRDLQTKTNCTTCFHERKGICAKVGQEIPEDFRSVGCDDWIFSDIPF